MSPTPTSPRLVWRAREVMATRGMFQTTDLLGHLEERGVMLSRAQIHRVITGEPARLNMHLLAALCDILDCTPADLLTPEPDSAPGGG